MHCSYQKQEIYKEIAIQREGDKLEYVIQHLPLYKTDKAGIV